MLPPSVQYRARRALMPVRLGHRLLVAAVVSMPAVAFAISEEAPSVDVLTFDGFIRATAPVCDRASSTTCFVQAFDHADSDGDSALTVDELRAVRDALEDWALWRDGTLTVQERNGIRLGLWLVDTVGLEQLHQSYDADGDGLISQPELLADVTLDDRPMADVLLDPVAVDRGAVARRLGAWSALLDQALPGAPD